MKKSKNRPTEGIGREANRWSGGATREVYDGGRCPNRVQYAFKENKKDMGGL